MVTKYGVCVVMVTMFLFTEITMVTMTEDHHLVTVVHRTEDAGMHRAVLVVLLDILLMTTG